MEDRTCVKCHTTFNYPSVLRAHMKKSARCKDINHNIIENQNPKIHYKVGSFIQKFSIVLKRILPDKVYEKILMNHYKL